MAEHDHIVRLQRLAKAESYTARDHYRWARDTQPEIVVPFQRDAAALHAGMRAAMNEATYDIHGLVVRAVELINDLVPDSGAS